MKQNNNKPDTPKSSLYYRIIIGSVLFYIVGTLYDSYGELKEGERIIGMIFMIFFCIAAVYLLITGVVGWIKQSKKDKSNKNTTEDNCNKKE